MHPPLGRRLLPAVGLVTAALLVTSLTAVAPSYADETPGAPTETPSVDPASAPAGAAVEALQTVQQMLEPKPAATATDPAAAPDLTIALRDLRLRADDLPRSYRAQARAILDPRPDADPSHPWVSPQSQVFGAVRVHWDAGATNPTTSAYRALVGDVVNHVLAVYQAAGYRSPEPDGTIGGDSKLDIYLENLGSSGLYGFCDTDTAPDHAPYDVPAYCAFDDNFAEFPNRSQEQNLEVTAAHELFHAVQFAYDYGEDGWFMEATATWAEDEVYTAINDNRQYLRESPLRQPRQSLDQLSRFSLRQYGEWIFFRYLSERYPHERGGLPDIMLNLWKRVDSTRGPSHDDYSIRAVNRELVARGTDLRHFYARFAAANRHPATAYSEGRAYPSAPAAGSWRFTKRSHATARRTIRLNHLSSATMVVRPASGVRGWKLHLAVDMPNLSRGSAAIVTTYDAKGRPTTKWMPLSSRGNGTVAIRLTSKVTRVDLTLSNAGIHYDCWVESQSSEVLHSCYGRSFDDRQPVAYRLWATR